MKEQSVAFETRNDLPKQTRAPIIDLLNQQLADTFDLYSQTKQAHWNVKGIHFRELHLMFDEFAASLIEHIDLIAERATALGGLARGTARMAAESSRLPEFPLETVADGEVVEVLADRFANYAASTRQAMATANECDDQDTMDMLTEISRTIDKYLWFLEAHLQIQSPQK